MSSGSAFNVQRRIAAGLGWFSIGLGLFELAAPRTLSRLVGIERPQTRCAPRLLAREPSSTIALLLRTLGAREVLSGIGILTGPQTAAWLWSRVVGDTMDLSLLGLALSGGRGDRLRLSGATATVLGITVLDVLASVEFTRVRRRLRRSWSVIGHGVPAGRAASALALRRERRLGGAAE